MTISSDRVQGRNNDRAEAAFKKKQERLIEGEQAMAQYEADRRAVQEKTARLRALRLARDAAENPAIASAAKKSPTAASAAKKKRSA